MGAGASAAEGRIFCHHCGARTASTGEDRPYCTVCGATDGVEVTDARLPVTSPSASPSNSTALANRSSGTTGGSSSSPSTRGAAGGTGFAAEAAAPQPTAMRVESVTVVALQRPEDGSLLLRVLPHGVARAAGSGANPPASVTEGASEHEDLEVPLEPACNAFVSRLQAEPLSLEDLKRQGNDSVCVICADDIAEEGTPVVALSCGHTFHDACIRRWLTRRHTCPTCRLELEVDDVKYLRSIGLVEEADALEKVEQERQAREMEKQAAARRRWVESMRRGDPVHFGLVCSRCGQTPLTGDCYLCTHCEGYILCNDCYAAREARLVCGEALCNDESSASGEVIRPEDEHPEGHNFTPFGAGLGGAGNSDGGSPSVPPGVGGLLTVLVPAPVRPLQQQQEQATSQETVLQNEAPGEAALAAAEVAFAAVRSLALAPLAGASPQSQTQLGGTGGNTNANVGGNGGVGGSRWPHGQGRSRRMG